MKWLNVVPPTTPPPGRSARSSILLSACVPSLTIGSTRSMTTSVLTQGIRVTQQKLPPPPKAEPIRSYIEVGEQGAIADFDESQGGGQDFAEASPVKGKQHVSSEVCIPITLSLSANLLPLKAIIVIQKPSKPLTKFPQLDLPDGLSYQSYEKLSSPWLFPTLCDPKTPGSVPQKFCVGSCRLYWQPPLANFKLCDGVPSTTLYVFTYLSFIY